MLKPTLRIGFVDYFKGLDEFFNDWLSRAYDVVRDDTNPDYLIFCDETFGNENLKYDPNKVVKIFYTGENRRVWNYQAHVGITFDHIDDPRHYRLPLYVIDHWIMTMKLGMPSIWGRSSFKETLIPQRTKFCCFISGNPGNPHRNDFFQKLNNYKKVDAYGPLFNNVGFVLPRGDEAAKNKDSVMQEYRFNLCFENGRWPGYCTEKLMHALYSGCIGIYAGSSTAALDFNQEAFLSWHDDLSDDALLQRIIEIDKNQTLYERTAMTPIFSKNAQNVWSADRFLQWFSSNVYGLRKHQ